MTNELQNCPKPFKLNDPHILECLREQRQATAHVLEHVRQLLEERDDPYFMPAHAETVRQRKRLEKAFELFKQADAHLHILIGGPGGEL